MRPSIPRLIRIVPRSKIVAPEAQVRIVQEPPRELVQRTTLYEILLKRKKDAGDSYPPNIRLEPPLTKEMFAEVKPWKVKPLKDMVRER